jgi:hypothetical protein
MAAETRYGGSSEASPAGCHRRFVTAPVQNAPPNSPEAAPARCLPPSRASDIQSGYADTRNWPFCRRACPAGAGAEPSPGRTAGSAAASSWSTKSVFTRWLVPVRIMDRVPAARAHSLPYGSILGILPQPLPGQELAGGRDEGPGIRGQGSDGRGQRKPGPPGSGSGAVIIGGANIHESCER